MVKDKFKDFLECYLEIKREDYGGGNVYIPVPKLMKKLSVKWNCTQKEARQYLQELPFTIGRFRISKNPPRKGMPKTQMIETGLANPIFGKNYAYFISVFVKEPRKSEGSEFHPSHLKYAKSFYYKRHYD